MIRRPPRSTLFPYTPLSRSPPPPPSTPEPAIPGFSRLGHPADRHRCGELPRPPRGAGVGPQRVSRRRRALGAGLDRNDRRARPRFRGAAVGQRCAAAVRHASRMARRARGAQCPVPLSPGPTLRATRAPRRGGDPRAAAASRGRAVRYVLLAAAVLTTLTAALLLGPAHGPVGDLLASPVVWPLKCPRALLAFLVGGALGVSG